MARLAAEYARGHVACLPGRNSVSSRNAASSSLVLDLWVATPGLRSSSWRARAVRRSRSNLGRPKNAVALASSITANREAVWLFLGGCKGTQSEVHSPDGPPKSAASDAAPPASGLGRHAARFGVADREPAGRRLGDSAACGGRDLASPPNASEGSSSNASSDSGSAFSSSCVGSTQRQKDLLLARGRQVISRSTVDGRWSSWTGPRSPRVKIQAAGPGSGVGEGSASGSTRWGTPGRCSH